MSFEDAERYLDALGVDAMKSMRPSMRRIEAICEALNHPEHAVPAVHVTGTNGKTSTARIASALLAATGLSVGTYTSPHLQTMRERLTLGGEPISARDFGEVFDHLLPYVRLVEGQLGEGLTYFEILTAMFFLWAAEQPVDAMVVEVGLGGRWDATNVITAPVSIITNVGLDHTKLLGEDRLSIAAEKSGIIKRGAVAVTAAQRPDVLTVVDQEAAKVGATTSVIGRDFALTDNRVAFGGRYLSLHTSARAYEGLFLPLHGRHQGVNAATALEAVTRFLPAKDIEQEVVQEGLSSSTVLGRIETVRPMEDAAPVVLDVAHNPEGMSALVASLIEAFAFERIVFVIGILSDKDYVGMLTELRRVPVASTIATQARSVRSVGLDDLAAAATQLGVACEVIDDVAKAVDAALAQAGASDLVCVTGSHYVVGEARDHLVGRENGGS